MNILRKKSIVFLAIISVMTITACSSNEFANQINIEQVEVKTPTNRTYPIVDTNQTVFYNDTTKIDAVSSEKDDFYGQDAQFTGLQPNYTVSKDKKVVYDNNTALTWMRGPNTTLKTPTKEDKMSYEAAKDYVEKVNKMKYGGYSDWRLPSAKELYSLIQFSGFDPDPMSKDDGSDLVPFIDAKTFNFAYGETQKRERIIDSQYLTSNVYVSNDSNPDKKLYFGVNFADGRIKGYGALMPFGDHIDKTYFVQLVRGNTQYGINEFKDNKDGTISDNATGLMWSKDDSGEGMIWKDALALVQEANSENYLGHSDWRLPNAKEMQSIVDYRNGPDYNDKPAIDTDFFNVTSIVNEENKKGYPWYWTGTTHLNASGSASAGVYIPMGRAMGYDNGWSDVHGAGCQRSDPKSDVLSTLTKDTNGYYNGGAPQGDAIRVYNFVRLVRNIN